MTPVLLELGGKCPVIIDSSVNVKIAANRVAWGKMMNGGGQICVAPDFVLIEKSIQSEFCEALKESFAEMLDSEKAIEYYRFQINFNIVPNITEELSRKDILTVLLK
jgi:aldehyde dehydrogenase (NAD+)